MDTSIFTDIAAPPTAYDLESVLGNTYCFWNQLKEYVLAIYPKGVEGWNYPGVKYGWSFRIKDKKRTIVYLLPRQNYFKVALVFGEKAATEALQSRISKKTKEIIKLAPVYAEGRGFRINVTREDTIEDIKILIRIKLAN